MGRVHTSPHERIARDFVENEIVLKDHVIQAVGLQPDMGGLLAVGGVRNAEPDDQNCRRLLTPLRIVRR